MFKLITALGDDFYESFVKIDINKTDMYLYTMTDGCKLLIPRK